MASSSFVTVNWPQLSCYGGAAICAYLSAKQGVRLLKNTLNIFIGSASFNERVKDVMDSNLPLYHKSKNLLVGSENFTARFNHLGKALLNASFGVLSGIATYILFDMASQMNVPVVNDTPSAQDQANRLKEQSQLKKIDDKIDELFELNAIYAQLNYINQNKPNKLISDFKRKFDQIFDKIFAHYYNRSILKLPQEIKEMLSFDHASPNTTELKTTNEALIQNTISETQNPSDEKVKSTSLTENSQENKSSSLHLNQFKAFLEHLTILVEKNEKYLQNDLTNQENRLTSSIGPLTFKLHKACEYLEDSFKNPSEHIHSWGTSFFAASCKPYFEARDLKEQGCSTDGRLEDLADDSPRSTNNQAIAMKILANALKDPDIEIQECIAEMQQHLDKGTPSELRRLATSNSEVCILRPTLANCPKKTINL